MPSPFTSPVADLPLTYLSGYSPATQARVRERIGAGTLGTWLSERYPGQHAVTNDRALYDFTLAIKQRYLRTVQAPSKVAFDDRLETVRQALGLQTTVARVQGGRLKAKREIRIASVFKRGPPQFLRAIVVHELAHLKEREHDKAFYQLCTHMEPDYHQLEFDLRLYLTQRELDARAPAAA